MSKTPVTILQEVAAKHCNTSLPVYKETNSITGLHINKFVIRVDWDSTSAVGTGLSKKEAKQNAARNMLSVLLDSGKISKDRLVSISGNVSMFSNETAEAPIASATINTDNQVSNVSSLSTASTSDLEHSFVNYVGLLQECCVSKNVPVPRFDVVNISGPDHKTEFTVRCTVLSHSEEASANTKKLAKQLSAKKMLQCMKGTNNIIKEKTMEYKEKTIESCVNDLNVDIMNLKIEEPQASSSRTEKALETYAKQKQKSNLSIKDMKIENYHKIFSNLCYNIPEIKKVILMYDYKSKICDVPNIKLQKNMLSNVFNTMVEEITFRANNNYDFVVGLKLSIKPSIIQIGIGSSKKEAERQAVYKLLQFISLFIR